MSAVISLDLGTTGNRAIAYSDTGEVLDSYYLEFAQSYPQPGWVEHDPMDIWQTAKSALEAVLKTIDAPVALAITNQRETTIIWDRKTGEPIYPGIVWQCRRTADYCASLAQHAAMIKAKTGLLLDAYFSASKIRWILDHVDGAQKRAKKGELCFGTVDSWILWQLTDGKIHATDPSNVSRTMLYNIHEQAYDDALLALFDIPKALLPEVLPSNAVFGHVSQAISKEPLPIHAVLGDQQAALFAQCGADGSSVKATYGTGLFVMKYTGSQPPETASMISTVAWQKDGSVGYALEGSMFTAGALISWLKDGIGVIEKASETAELALSVPDTAGVWFIPALAGLGAPHWNPDARGAFIGLSRATTKAHMVRAVLESIAFRTKEITDVMAPEMKRLRVDGGVSENTFLMQFLADLLGVTIEKTALTEMTALGAAAMAAIKIGFWEEEAFRGRVAIEKNYVPAADNSALISCFEQWKRALC